MANRRTYFRIRRVAAAELLRLDAAGQAVNAEAMEWARMTIAGIDDVGGRPPAKERVDILALLAQHPEDGQTPDQVAAGLGNLNVKTMQNVLYNMRKQGHCAVVKSMGRAIYFHSQAAADAQRPRLERERQAVHEAARKKRGAAAKAKCGAIREQTSSAAVAAPASRASSEAPPMPPSARACGGQEPAVDSREVRVIYPPNVKKQERQTPLALIDRFGVADPQARLPGGFHEEWLALRAGGSEA